ncbi:hypothetical protein NW752_002312 [Fusarium irregulare]|uniref:Uncharacterized protein n=1 Tax=Fusarium irregulare TaxID=2494466 RepID=A0A9W8PGK6_9HYPO|nr:hypothetical protein NW766_011029 [Fusarium irregulare]KAJ4024859.1 hypothetical protein NW752_002312 [Fusarium irregulare]
MRGHTSFPVDRELPGWIMSPQSAYFQNGSSDGQAPVQQFQRQLIAAMAEIENIGDELEPLVAKYGNDALDKLELAINKLYKVAVFVRGNYDGRELDVGQRDSLLQQMVDAFQTMENVAEAGLKAIGDRNSTILDLETTKITPAKNEIEQLARQMRSELNSMEDEIRAMQDTAAMFQRVAKDESNAADLLQEKIRQAEESRRDNMTPFDFLTFGRGRPDNDDPLSSVGLRRELDEVHERHYQAERQLGQSRYNLDNLLLERNELDTRLLFVSQAEQLVPQVISAAKATGFRTAAGERRFAPLKQAASQLLASAREIQRKALMTQGTAQSKKEFVDGLLRICIEGLMDQALEDEARLVRDEIVNEYGGQLPSDIEKLATELTEKINTFASLPSLRQVTA